MRETVSLSAAWTKAGDAFCYKRAFHLYQKWAGKRVRLHLPSFPVGCCASVNDCPVPLRGDSVLLVGELTPYVDFDGPNRLTVTFPAEAANEALLEKAALHLTDTATVETVYAHACTDKAGDRILTVEIKAENEGLQKRQLQVVHTLFDARGKKIKKCNSGLSLAPFSACEQTQTLTLPNIAPWTTEEPTLYTLKTELTEKGQTVDSLLTDVGFRDVRVDARRALLFEGKPCKMKAMAPVISAPCTVGSVFDYAMQTAQVLGVNTFWVKEGAQAADILTKCDRKGFLCVLDLSASVDPVASVIRYRSHPCLVAWAYAVNPMIEQDGRGLRSFQRLSVHLRRTDATRPLILSVSAHAHIELLSEADMISIPYEKGEAEALRQRLPQKPIFLQSTLSDMDGANATMAEHGYLGGVYMTHFATESFAPKCLMSIDGYPSLRFCYGERQAYVRLQAAWQTHTPVVFLSVESVPTEEGYLCRCRVDSNCKKVTLYADGRPLKGHTALTPTASLWTDVPVLGYIEAVAFSDGKEVARTSYEIPDKAYGLRLYCDRIPRPFTEGEVAYLSLQAVDSEGRAVCTEDFSVNLTLSDALAFDRPEGGGSATLMTKNGKLYFALRRVGRGEQTVHAQADGYMPTKLRLP